MMNSIVPAPKSVEIFEEKFILKACSVGVSFHNASKRDSEILYLRLSEFCLPKEVSSGADLSFHFDQVFDEDEAYELKIAKAGIEIYSQDITGALHALESLKQLTIPEIYRGFSSEAVFTFPCCEIYDYPSMIWRGGLLDIARHFYDKEVIKKTISLFGVHKLNYLQLHLTDDQGWRVESTKFPLLNEIGSHRRESQLSHFEDDKIFDATPHGGFLSKADIVEIIAFAETRGITVVPEIEIPGHTAALLAAYPEYGIPKISREVHTEWGIFKSLLSPLPKAIDFMKEVLDEIYELFPSPLIHVGGDESLQAVWLEDPDIAAYMKEGGIKDARELFENLMTEIANHARSHGRRIITWDDAFASGFRKDTDTVIMAWRGTKIAQRAANSGHNVVLAPVIPFYFDYYQAESPDEPQAIGGPISIEDVLSFDLASLGWSEEEKNHLLGCQFQLWTEFIRTSKQLEYMMWPRACAFSEISWQSQASDPADFMARFKFHEKRLQALNVNYRPINGPHPWQKAGEGINKHTFGWDFHARTAEWDSAAQEVDLVYSPPPAGAIND